MALYAAKESPWIALNNLTCIGTVTVPLFHLVTVNWKLKVHFIQCFDGLKYVLVGANPEVQTATL